MQTHHLPFSAERVRGGPPGHGPARAAGPAMCCPSLHICERAPEAPGGQWPGRTWPRARPSTGLIISWGAGCRALMPLGSWCRIAGRASALPEQNPPSWHWLALTDCVRRAPVRLHKHGPERPLNPEKWHRHGRIPWRRKRRTRTPKQGPRTLGAYKWPSPLHSSHLGPGGRPGQAPCPLPGGPRSRAVSWLFLCHSPLLKEPPGSPAGQVGPLLRGGAEDAPRGVGRTGGQHLVAGGAASPSAGPG